MTRPGDPRSYLGLFMTGWDGRICILCEGVRYARRRARRGRISSLWWARSVLRIIAQEG